jgi:hypothetical protein
MIIKQLDPQQLAALCGVLADTSRGLSKSEITQLLGQCGIAAVDEGLNKRSWLYKCFGNDIRMRKSFVGVYSFTKAALAPVRFTDSGKRDSYEYLFEETNKVLVLAGLSIDKTGSISEVVSAATLDEADIRVNSLKQKFYHRAIHSEVTKYCVKDKDCLRKDYYDAVFEAAKGLGERIRQLSGLDSDGSALFNKIFSMGSPYLAFMSLKPLVSGANF